MSNYKLTHPLYLDTQMMISFLAYIEGGVSLESEETIKSEGSKEKKGSGSAKIKFPTLSTILGLEASATAELASKNGETRELKEARHHTSASLFNALYDYLDGDDQIRRVTKVEELPDLKPGQLVEISGRYAGNPLEHLLALFNQWFTYFPNGEPEPEEGRSRQRRQGGGNRGRGSGQGQVTTPEQAMIAAAQRAEEQQLEYFKRLMQQMKEDIDNSPVHDVLLERPEGIRAILTVSSDYYSTKTNEFLMAGEFTALGKVTRVLGAGDKINLARRTVFGTAGEAAIEELVNGVANTPEIHVDAANPVVESPALQILPMAIFV
ncbi:hypothetical protein POF50_004540 [Streptomyces sp. SL13]|uniref:Uncharacterized protein n=1 Tax=Streptantibioticus silvisoli TaxID=2705255 RepID=A0AA90GV97_9ACTN|nr:hypothetical protein [Streptantibioticus silvisoli]MDI5968619.1 hypothetical protein [Streptantibioticus silvisoli]